MPSAAEIKAGAAYVELYLRDNRFTRGLKAAEQKLRALGSAAQNLGRRLAAVSAAALTPVAFSTKTFADFSDQMAVVRAVTGATEDQFRRLTEQAKELGRTTSYTAAQVARGMTELGRAGFQPGEIQAATPAILNLARATGTELAEAAEIAAAALRGFNLDATEMQRVSDVLVAAANNSSQTLTNLGESLKYAVPMAAEAGESIESVSKALGTMANMGIKGTMAGTALRNLFLQLSNTDVQKMLREVNIEAVDAAGNLRPAGDILTEIGRQMSTMGSAQRMAWAEKLFGRRAIGGALKMAATRFEALNNAIDNASGTASKTAAIMDDTLGGAFRRLLSAVEGVQIAIGETLGPVIRAVAAKVTALAGVVTEWIQRNQGLVVAVVAATAGLLAFGGALFTVGVAAKLLAFALSVPVAILSTLGAVLGALLTPIGLASAAVISLGAYLVKASGAGGKALQWLGDRFGELGDWARTVFQGIADALAAGDISLAAKIAWESLRAEWIRGINWLQEKWIDFKEAFMATWTEAVYGIAEIFVNGAAKIEAAWVEVAGVIVDKWKWAEEKVAQGIGWIIAKAEGLDSAEVAKNLAEQYAGEARARETGRAERLADIEASRKERAGILEGEREAAHVKRRQGYDAELKAGAARLAEAEAKLSQLRTEAARARERVAREVATSKARQGGDAVFGAPAAAGASPRGTFSARAAGLLGGGNALTDIRKASQDSARSLKRIDANLERIDQLKWVEGVT